MGFKDMVAADISAVFLNPDEFGETHNLNGTDCVCVISGDETDKRSAALLDSRRTPDGLSGDFVTVCVKASDLPYIPKMGTNFKVDGKLYKVDTCTNDMGMLTMTLGAYRMGVPLR
jgi:hypothetical protein